MRDATANPRRRPGRRVGVADAAFAAGLDDSGRDAKALGVELRASRPAAVVVQEVDGSTRLFPVPVGVESLREIVEAAGFGRVALPAGPFGGRAGAVDGLDDLPRALLGMEEFDDPDLVGEPLVGDVPDPGGSPRIARVRRRGSRDGAPPVDPA